MKLPLLYIAIITLCLYADMSASECDNQYVASEMVKYVCDYQLVSATQCQVWTEDMKQMDLTNKIIIEAFISWDADLEE